MVNVGSADRFVRAPIEMLSPSRLSSRPQELGSTYSQRPPLRHCPLYAVFGVSTCRLESR
jgi:hypothetical protein